MIDPTADRPQYQQLADVYRAAIKAGEYAPGDLLPSQAQLSSTHDVSVTTVREAIDVLRNEGLVRSQRGRGVYVREPVPVRHVTSTRYARQLAALAGGEHRYESAFTLDLGISWDSYDPECHFEELPADEAVASLLDVDPGTPLYARHMVLRSAGEAHQIRTSYYPFDIVDGTPMMDEDRQPWPGGVAAELAELGLLIVYIDEFVTTRMPTPDEASTLRMPPGTPVLVVTRIGAAGGRRVEAADMVMPGHKISLHYHINLEHPER